MKVGVFASSVYNYIVSIQDNARHIVGTQQICIV